MTRGRVNVLRVSRTGSAALDAAPGEERYLATRRPLRTDVIRLASRFGRYGYRQITNLLRIEGWEVNHKRVESYLEAEGLKVPTDGNRNGVGCGSTMARASGSGHCTRYHVWSYDFVSTRTHDGRALKLLTVLDEYTRQCLAKGRSKDSSSRRSRGAHRSLRSARSARAICARTTGQSSRRNWCGDGWPGCGSRPSTVAPGSPWVLRLQRELQRQD